MLNSQVKQNPGSTGPNEQARLLSAEPDRAYGYAMGTGPAMTWRRFLGMGGGSPPCGAGVEADGRAVISSACTASLMDGRNIPRGRQRFFCARANSIEPTLLPAPGAWRPVPCACGRRPRHSQGMIGRAPSGFRFLAERGTMMAGSSRAIASAARPVVGAQRSVEKKAPAAPCPR
jgi:hypothetical protein